VPDQDPVTVVVVGGLRPRTGAGNVASAYVEPLTLGVPGRYVSPNPLLDRKGVGTLELTDIPRMACSSGHQGSRCGPRCKFLPTKMADVAAPTAGVRLTAAVPGTGAGPRLIARSGRTPVMEPDISPEMKLALDTNSQKVRVWETTDDERGYRPTLLARQLNVSLRATMIFTMRLARIFVS
jgi:hypothetical protein